MSVVDRVSRKEKEGRMGQRQSLRRGRYGKGSSQKEKRSGAKWQRERERQGRGISTENEKGRGRGIATRSRRAGMWMGKVIGMKDQGLNRGWREWARGGRE